MRLTTLWQCTPLCRHYLTLGGVVLLAVFFVASAPTPSVTAASSPMLSYDAYLTQLVTLHQDVVAAENGTLPVTTVEVASTQAEAIQQVMLPDGEIQPVNMRLATAPLRAQPPDLSGELQQLDAILADAGVDPATGQSGGSTLAAGLAPTARTWDDLHRLEAPTPWQAFMQGMQQRLGQLWQNLLALLQQLLPAGAFHFGMLGNAVAYALMGTGVLILALVMLVFVFLLRRRLLRQAATALPLASILPTLRDPEQAFAEAHRLANAQMYREALRYLLLSALLWLDQSGQIAFDPALTNREYLEILQRAPELLAPARALFVTFDEVWYGHQDCDSAHFQDCVEAVEHLRSESMAEQSASRRLP